MSRRVPERTCVGCRESTAADALVRFVASPDGEVVVDLRGRLPGRGAWVHARPSCLERAVKVAPKALAGKGRPLDVDASLLPERVLSATEHAVAEGLSIAAAAGGLARGRSAVKQAVAEGRATVVLVAHDAAERTRRQAEALPEAEVQVVPLSSDDLGQQVGRGALAVVAVLDVPASRHLRRQLRRLRQLG